MVLDDIDRLSTSEIRDIFKLVRLTASFPNIIYLVAFDRIRVEKALKEQGIKGRDYLEKILQVAYDLPSISNTIFVSQINATLEETLARIENIEPVDKQVWPDIVMDIIRPLMRNMRDIRRYTTAIHGTVKSLNKEVALADLLALEAIRVFMPDIYVRLQDNIEVLTDTYDFENPANFIKPEGYDANKITSLIDIAKDQKGIARRLIALLFPAAAQHVGGVTFDDEWRANLLKARRVGHADILRLYLERSPSSQLQAFNRAESIWKHMDNYKGFDRQMRAVPLHLSHDVIESFTLFENQFMPEHVVPGSTVLLNLLPLPGPNQDILIFSPESSVTRVVYRLLKCLESPEAIDKAVREILSGLNTLSSKLALLELVGHREDVGQQMVTELVASILEETWRNRVRSASVEELTNEYNLLGILLRTKRGANEAEPPLNIDKSPQITLAVLRAAESEITSHTGGRSVHRKPCLSWKDLLELYGDKEMLRRRIQDLKDAKFANTEELISLAEEYLAGRQDEMTR